MLSTADKVKLEILYKGEPFIDLEKYCETNDIKIIITSIDGYGCSDGSHWNANMMTEFMWK